MTIKRVLIGLAIIALGCSLAVAQSTKSTVLTTAHDLGYAVGPPVVTGAGCSGCHTPHSGTNGTILLWDNIIPVVNFGTYTSPTLDNSTSEIGGSLPLATDDRSHSLLCMSCHDGDTATANSITVAAGFLIASGSADPRSPGLTEDHPVNMEYLGVPDTENGMIALASLDPNILLFGATNTVQCASCHNPHDSTNTPFLRIDNSNSGLCTSCHL